MVTSMSGISGCSSSNSSSNKNKNKNSLTIKITFAIWSFLTLASFFASSTTVQGAAVYSNVDFLTNPNFEPICNTQEERYIESDGKESSLILEFNPGQMAEKRKSCTRILSAPADYGFIVRLILPKIRHRSHHPQTTATTTTTAKKSTNSAVTEAGATSSIDVEAVSKPALSGMTSLIDKLNTTAFKTALGGRTCPLSIFSSLDPHIPQWRVDPCQLEDTAPEMEDPVRLFHGRVRIVWEHGQHKLHSKLMVTALARGEQCRNENKHQCLKIGDEPILCISKELVCDGIRHCPYSNEYDSDEDYAMCWKRRRFGEPAIPPAMESDIFEHFALEVFRNLFAFDVPTLTEVVHPDESILNAATNNNDSNAGNSTTLRKVLLEPIAGNQSNVTTVASSPSLGNGTSTTPIENGTENANTTTGHGRRNSTRSGLHSDLSKYGPWGYLMLGMLLCGGALLICGLWASATQHAANNERESALQNAGAHSLEHQSSNAGPPNYEELDPPPAYSVLFPNQKAASSTTLNSMAATTLAATPSAAIAATSGVNTSLISSSSSPTTTTTMTEAATEAATVSGSSDASSVRQMTN